MIWVASYCRVSTDKDDQANSFETQKQFFSDYIERHPDWQLYEVYADQGITGTSTKKRAQFNRMICDAHAGKFQLVLTKEVSRFSRNILDTIAFTRELKSIGVAVLFVTDSINTLDPDAELRLSIMASIAQEESRRTSSRVIWGQTRQMEKGVVFGHSMLGYDVHSGRISINPEGAEIIKLIFQKYAVEQVSTCEIARFLTRKGYLTYKGSTQWRSSGIIKILKNEKYVGDLVQKKTYTADFLTHKKRINHGEFPKIIIKDHHNPIISREIWNLAQERLRKQDKHGDERNAHSNRYLFSGKIKCGECGASFVARKKYQKDGSYYRRWCCFSSIREGCEPHTDIQGKHLGCDVGKLLRDDDALNMLKTAFRSLQIDTEAIICCITAVVLDVLRTEVTYAPKNLQYEITQVERKKEKLMDCYLGGDITKEDMQFMIKRYEKQLKMLHERLSKVEEQKTTNDNADQLKAAIRTELASILNCETESELFYKNVLDRITVFKDRHLELRLTHLPHIFHFTG